MHIAIWSEYYPDYNKRLAAMSNPGVVWFAFYNASNLELVS